MDELGEIRAALMEAVIKIDALRDAAAEYRKKFDAAGVIGRGERDTAWGKTVDDYTAKFNAAGKAMRDALEADAAKTPLIFKTEGEARAYNKGVADGHSGAQVPGIGVWYYK